MSKPDIKTEKPAEILRVEDLFREYAKPENDHIRNKIVEEIEANLNAAKTAGFDVDLYWNAFDELFESTFEKETGPEIAAKINHFLLSAIEEKQSRDQ